MAYTTIDDPTIYFNTKLYSGTGSSNSVTGVGFQPDLTWIKSRSVNGAGHRWHDSVRGAGNMIASDSTAAEFDDSALFTSFDTDGFTVAGTGSSYNGSSQTYASWNWLAGGSASSNSSGDITSSVSVDTTAGFSIVSYTGNGSSGATVGHSLSAKPGLMIIKNRDEADSWQVYHHKNTSAPATETLQLNETGATSDTSNRWNDTEPTTTLFTLGDNTTVNKNTIKYIGYIFAEKKGYSKFGSYTGNGNADGTFVYTGQKSAFVMIKQTNATGENWFICDNKRAGYNAENNRLMPNISAVEQTDSPIDILSNGFKARETGAKVNASGGTYIYMCFAENPFVTSTGIPTTAR